MSDFDKRSRSPIADARDETLAFAIRVLGKAAVIVVASVLAVIGGSITTALVIGFLAIPDKTSKFETLAMSVAIAGAAILGATVTGFLVYLAFTAGSYFKRRSDDLLSEPLAPPIPPRRLLDELRRELSDETQHARLPQPHRLHMNQPDQIVDGTTE